MDRGAFDTRTRGARGLMLWRAGSMVEEDAGRMATLGANESPRCRVAAVVPVYNHHHTVGRVLESLDGFGLPLVIVDDGSVPEGRTALEKIAIAHRALLIRLDQNSGKGAAVLAGLRAATARGFTHALQVDADGQHTLSDVPRFVEAARRDPDAVICGRPIFDASLPRSRFFGRKINHFFVVIETLSRTRIRDSMCGFRLYPVRAVLEEVDRSGIGPRMDFDVEILVKLAWRSVALRWLDTRVSYPADGISHFRLWRDNMRLIAMHVRLLTSTLWRAPPMLWRRKRKTA